MPISDEELQVLIEKIALDHNWDLNGYKPDTLKRRIQMRMTTTQKRTVEEYDQLISEDEQEYRNLINAITVNYTYWFRDEMVWEEILKIMYEKAQTADGPIRIWSAGCATGEEPYSLAILAKRVKALHSDAKFEIIATDVDEVALEKAKKGEFQKDRVNLDEKEIDKYFNKRSQTYEIKDEIKELIRFSKLDLTQDAYPAKLDMIICRNVMIYFEKSLQTQVYQDFYYALKAEGYLITGSTESLPPKIRNLFGDVNLDRHIFKKI